MSTRTIVNTERPALRLRREEIRRLHQVNPLIFLSKFTLWITLLMMAGVCAQFTSALPKIVCQIVIGVLFVHGVELAHSCVHHTGTGSRRWDPFLGKLLAWPMGVNFASYFYGHHRHHAKVGTKEDFESFSYQYYLFNAPDWRTRILGFLLHLSMVSHYFTVVKNFSWAVSGHLSPLLRRDRPELSDKMAARIQREYRVMACGLAGLVVLSVFFCPLLLLDLWLIPLVLVAGPLHALIELPEHFATDFPNPNIFCNTREIETNWFLRYLTNSNNFHGLHHLDGNIPFERLPQLKALVHDRFKHRSQSYLAFYRDFLRMLWNGHALAK